MFPPSGYKFIRPINRADADVFQYMFRVTGWSGGYGDGEPPDTIPNSAVKIVSADGTAS